MSPNILFSAVCWGIDNDWVDRNAFTSQLNAHGHKSFINQLVGIHGLTANRFPNSQTNSIQSLRASRFSWPEQKTLLAHRSLFHAGRRRQSQVVGPSPVRIRHAHTGSSLSQPRCVRCRLLPPQVSSWVLLGPRVLLTLPAYAWSDPSVSFFYLFVIFLSRCRLSVS